MTRKRLDHLKLVEPPTAKPGAEAAQPLAPTIERARSPRAIEEADDHLSEEERGYWQETVLACEGRLMPADRATLAVLVKARADFADACKQITDIGKLIKTPNGYPVQNPYIALKKAAASEILSASRELGLTPNARNRTQEKAAKGKTFGAFKNLKDASSIRGD